MVDGSPHEIVGVMPPDFTFPGIEAALFVPLQILAPDVAVGAPVDDREPRVGGPGRALGLAIAVAGVQTIVSMFPATFPVPRADVPRRTAARQTLPLVLGSVPPNDAAGRDA